MVVLVLCAGVRSGSDRVLRRLGLGGAGWPKACVSARPEYLVQIGDHLNGAVRIIRSDSNPFDFIEEYIRAVWQVMQPASAARPEVAPLLASLQERVRERRPPAHPADGADARTRTEGLLITNQLLYR